MLGSRFCRTASICVAAWIAAMGASAFAEDQLELPAFVKKLEPSIVRIETKTAQGGGIGSGFVVDADGIVATNHHVMAGAQEGQVIFKNGETAKILGTFMLDKKRDVAIIKIDKKDLPAIKLAESLPQVGESVVAIGSPQGLSFSVSDGIISGIPSPKDFANFLGEERPGTWIQTTAPISPGNSGGPLIHRKTGEVLGANTLGSTAFGGQNLNFAISSIDIADVLKQGRKKSLVALSDGAAKSKHEHPKPKRKDLAADKIPKDKIEGYIKSARDSYKDALASAKKKLGAEKTKLTSMKSGRVGNTLAMQTPGGVLIIADRGKQLYQYADDDAKNKTVKKQQEEVRQAQEHHDKIQDPKTGMLAYLMKAGPQVELKEVGDVGCVSEIFVTTILENDEFLAHLDDHLPVAVRGMNARSVASGQAIPGRLMYVCAMQTFGSEAGGINIRVLRELPEDELAKHFEALGISPGTDAAQAKTETAKGTNKPAPASSAKPGEPKLRMWTAKSGHKIEATFVEKTGDKVVLKKKDGTNVTVPIAILSQEDLDLLKSLPEKAK
jgi:S1-C subfamily serine protease